MLTRQSIQTKQRGEPFIVIDTTLTMSDLYVFAFSTKQITQEQAPFSERNLNPTQPPTMRDLYAHMFSAEQVK
jgi:hypothetical protein